MSDEGEGQRRGVLPMLELRIEDLVGEERLTFSSKQWRDGGGFVRE